MRVNIVASPHFSKLTVISSLVVCNAFLVIWLLTKPGSHAVYVAVDNITQMFNMFLASCYCFIGWNRPTDSSHRRIHRMIPFLLGCGLFSGTLGQTIFTMYEQLLHINDPFPSWADVGFLGLYPFLLLGILLLPTNLPSGAARVRILFDSALVITAICIFSWYFILGPTIQQGVGTWAAKAVGATYTIFDFIITLTLLVMLPRFTNRGVRNVALLLCVALSIIVLSDSFNDSQSLNSGYSTGGFMDSGWPLGYMLIGVSAYFLRRVHLTTPIQSFGEKISFGKALVPYALLPAVALLIVYTRISASDPALDVGVYLGSGVLLGIILIRQIVAMRDIVVTTQQVQALNAQLQDAHVELRVTHDTLQATHEELVAQHEELALANVRLETLATTDALTQIANHRAMIDVLERELLRARRTGKPCSVLFMDIDHFKALNDAYGHSAGDVALQQFAHLVQAQLREIDVLGRWGGEEFVAILPETDESGAEVTAERIREMVAAYLCPIGGGVHLTCSIGISTYPIHGEDRDHLVALADQAMYTAKQRGRNRVVNATDLGNDTDVTPPTSREEAALLGTMAMLAAVINARDGYTGHHTNTVGKIAQEVAHVLGMAHDEARILEMAGYLHDLGKIGIPDAILCKPGKLTTEEWVIMRQHPARGAEIVRPHPTLQHLVPAIHSHHERWDGQGYPEGLAGEAIPLAARIIAVVDAFDAMTTDRPYRPAQPLAWALQELRSGAGSQFDPTVITALEQVLQRKVQQKAA